MVVGLCAPHRSALREEHKIRVWTAILRWNFSVRGQAKTFHEEQSLAQTIRSLTCA